MTFSWKPRGIGTSARFRKPPNGTLENSHGTWKIPCLKKGYCTFLESHANFQGKKTLQRDVRNFGNLWRTLGFCHPLVMAMHETKIGPVFENQTSIQAFSS